jgi:anthranilate synthase component 1
MLSVRPSFSQFDGLIRKGNLVPVSCEILADQDTPVSAFLKLKPGAHGFPLESVEGGERWARFSFLGAGASSVFRSRGRHIEVVEKGRRRKHEDVEDPFFAFRDFMKRYQPVATADMPRFYGGAVGYLGYDTVRFFEKLPERTEEVLDVWDIYLVFPDGILIFDKVSHTIRLVSCCYLPHYANEKEA